MEHVGIDLHENRTRICILTADGELIEQRIRTERTRCAEVSIRHPKSRILLEGGSET